MINVGIFSEITQIAKTIGSSTVSINDCGITINLDGLWITRKNSTESEPPISIIPNLQVRTVKKMATDFCISNGEATGKDKLGNTYSFPITIADECDMAPTENNNTSIGTIEANAIMTISEETVKTKTPNYWYFTNKSAYSLSLTEYYIGLIKAEGEFSTRAKFSITRTLCSKLLTFLEKSTDIQKETFNMSEFDCWDNKYLKLESDNYLIIIEVDSFAPTLLPIVKSIPNRFFFSTTGDYLKSLIVDKPTVSSVTELQVGSDLKRPINSKTANEVFKVLKEESLININSNEKFTYFSTPTNKTFIVGNAKI